MDSIITDKIDNYVLIGCESDVLFGNNELFNFWSYNFINKQIEEKIQDNRMPFYDFS